MKEPTYYNQKYADGVGFGTKPAGSRVHKMLQWLPIGGTVLDLGCGLGHDCEAMRQHGIEAIGVDYSDVGIKWARKRYPENTFLCEDLLLWEPDQKFDAIWCSGMSWYHYDLDGTIGRSGVDVPAQTKRFMSWLKPEGRFILLIATDFSGKRPDNGIHMNQDKDFRAAFAGFELVHRIQQHRFVIWVWENPLKIRIYEDGEKG